MALSWEKEKRLLKRAEFRLCYDNAIKLYSSNFIAFIRKKEDIHTRVGFAVTKKIGNAVMRNRLKRLLREYCRLNQALLPQNTDIVITPKKHLQIARLDYVQLEKELSLLFVKAR